MQSTLSETVPEYIGADLTDRYAAGCRDIDVCGLRPVGNSRLEAIFWHWRWDRAPEPLDVGPIAKELRGARVAMLDGPQGLANERSAIRVCERCSAAVGKTPDARPALNKPFAGFICSSLDLFSALAREGILVGPPTFSGGVFEVYPGHIWAILSGGRPLPRKATDDGRIARKHILESFGISGLPLLPTHDQNDACVAAMIAAAADGQISTMSVAAIGDPLSVDARGVLREGSMIIPRFTGASQATATPPPPPIETAASPVSNQKADELLTQFVSKALQGDPQVCTYAWAYRHLFDASYVKFSQAFTSRVIRAARSTHPRLLAGLGPVRLDTFIVSKQTRRPSDGYWHTAPHDREDWERALGTATVLD